MQAQVLVAWRSMATVPPGEDVFRCNHCSSVNMRIQTQERQNDLLADKLHELPGVHQARPALFLSQSPHTWDAQ